MWGTWIQACLYYHEHMDVVRDVVLGFNPDDAVCVGDAQALVVDEEVLKEVAYIAENYKFICSTIKNLETRGLSIEQQGSAMVLSVLVSCSI